MPRLLVRTSYTAGKGRELAENPNAALLFYWHALGRQVRVEGVVERMPAEESDAIFLARPRDSRISALASRESERIASRDQLETRVRTLTEELEGREVERPAFGAATASPPSRSSSGSTARTGSTSASPTAAPATPGRSGSSSRSASPARAAPARAPRGPSRRRRRGAALPAGRRAHGRAAGTPRRRSSPRRRPATSSVSDLVRIEKSE